MTKNQSFALFLALFAALIAICWWTTGRVVPLAGDNAFWFYGGLLTLLVGKFIVEYRLTKPNDVFVNCLAAFVAISTLNDPPNAIWWEIVRWGALGCGTLALMLAWDPGKEARLAKSSIRTFSFRVVTSLGSAQVLSSIVFVLALVSYLDLDAPSTFAFTVLWGAILLAAHLNLASAVRPLFQRQRQVREVIARTHSFLSPAIVFCTKEVSEKIPPHELVGFAQSAAGAPQCYGMVIDERASAKETLVTVALLNATVSDACLTDRTALVRLAGSELDEARQLAGSVDPEIIAKVVGTVASGTNISQLKFEVFGAPRISAGSLLGVASRDGQVFYQVFEGVIDEESTLSGSTRAFVEGEAEQIGTWVVDRGGFETHNWVAGERSLVRLVDDAAPAPEFHLKDNEATLGHIPGSAYPANVNIDELVLFHTGILGVTGSGKSFLTYNLVEECAARNIKVVCVDPTGDYQRYLHEAVLLGGAGSLTAFLNSADHRIAILETSSTTVHPIRQAAAIAKDCLDWCKAARTDDDVLNPRPKVLVVFEEAHLLIPEWNFNPERNLQDVVSGTSQIVLQSRKYGLGFLIVSQRTANVVKSVLNQCNTMVSFQAFDETGFDFLRNYMGTFHVRSLPNLKPRHAIAVGKASVSHRPVMVRFRDQDRELRAEPAPKMPVPEPPVVEE